MNGWLGRHLILEIWDIDPKVLDDLQKLREILIEAAHRAQATILKDLFYRFSPHGVSGVVLVAESHLFIHTWPEYGYAAVDIFTCGQMDLSKAAQFILENLSGKGTIIEIKRGAGLKIKKELQPAY